MKKQKGFIVLLLAVIVLLVGVVGYFVFVKKLEPVVQQTTPPPITTESSTSQQPSPAPINETANWKTYTQKSNTQEVYSISYPNNATIDQSHPSCVIIKNGPNIIFIRNSSIPYTPSVGELDEYVMCGSTTGRGTEDGSPDKNLNIGGVNYIAEGMGGYPGHWIFTYTENVSIIIAGSVSDSIKQILATLKSSQAPTTQLRIISPAGGETFVEGQTNMSSWKTFVNTKYGIRVKYPSDWRALNLSVACLRSSDECADNIGRGVTLISLATYGPRADINMLHIHFATPSTEVVEPPTTCNQVTVGTKIFCRRAPDIVSYSNEIMTKRAGVLAGEYLFGPYADNSFVLEYNELNAEGKKDWITVQLLMSDLATEVRNLVDNQYEQTNTFPVQLTSDSPLIKRHLEKINQADQLLQKIIPSFGFVE